MQFQELNNRFNKSNTELFICLACLYPKNLFAVVQFYPKNFSAINLIALEMQSIYNKSLLNLFFESATVIIDIVTIVPASKHIPLRSS